MARGDAVLESKARQDPEAGASRESRTKNGAETQNRYGGFPQLIETRTITT